MNTEDFILAEIMKNHRSFDFNLPVSAAQP